MPTNLQRARELFLHAVGKLPPEQWEDYVDEASGGDAELQKQVRHLLQVHREAGSFLEQPAVAVAEPSPTLDQPITEKPGTVIGPYKLLQQIGEGGMGVVYMAEQSEPVERRVALKIIKPGMDTRQVIARFEAERQALAMMDHPNISKVLDAGTTDSGRPYFVMELVKGIPLTKYCDEQHLTPKERLELFIPICQAVQHAHQKGIIHRDIKPSNILVALYDGQPVPKVIDFGVAKATSQKLTEKTMFTQYGQVVGTLEYMSPEQANLDQLDIDTRSDIYSLGVLLYELLTGATPFDKECLRSVAFEEMMRIIREEEPPRPSLRLSTIDTLPSVAANRKIEPKKLSVLVRGELDWIVMKALEKDRARRYETANGFANDIQRYLDDEPVVAGPPSSAYRLQKFVRRNKAGLATAATIAAIVILGILGTSWQAIRAAKAEAAEVRQRVAVNGQIESVLREASHLRSRIELGDARAPEAWNAVRRVAERADALAENALADPMLVRQVQAMKKSLDQEEADQRLIARLEEIRLNLAEPHPDEFRFHFELALNGYATLFTEEGLDPLTVSPAQAEPRLDKRSPDVRTALVVAMAGWIGALKNLKNPSVEDEQLQERLSALIEAVDTDPWRKRIRQAWEAKDYTSLVASANSLDVSRQRPRTLTALGRALCRSPDHREEGMALLRRAQRHYPADFLLNFTLAEQSSLAQPQRGDEAIRYYTAAVAVRPQSAPARQNLGTALRRQGQLNEAIAVYAKAIELDLNGATFTRSALGNALVEQDKLDDAIAEFRKVIELHPDLAGAHCNLGSVLGQQGKLGEAITEFRKAIELKPDHAPAHYNLGITLGEQDQLDEAITEFRKAIELKPDHAPAHYNLGITLRKQDQLDEAIAEYRKAIKLDPDYAAAYNNLATALEKQDKLDEAIAKYRKAIELDPKCAMYYFNLGVALARQDKLDEAIAKYRKAIELDPKCASAYSNLGVVLMEQDKVDEAIAEFRKALELDPEHAMAYFNLGVALAKQDKLDEAIAKYLKAIERSEAKPNDKWASKNRQVLVNHLANTATNWSWSLATAADVSERDPAKAVELANLAIKLQSDNPNHWNNFGVAQYRAENWQIAVDALKKADTMLEDGDRAHRMFLAMAHWQLGDKEKARELYAQGAAWIASHAMDNEELNRFRAEAEQLMDITEEDREKLVEEYLARPPGQTAEGPNEKSEEAGTEARDHGPEKVKPEE